MTPQQRSLLLRGGDVEQDRPGSEFRGQYAAAMEAASGPRIRKELLGEDHPDFAKSLNNLAGLYQAMGDFARAEPLYRQALEIRRKALGEDHPPTPRPQQPGRAVPGDGRLRPGRAAVPPGPGDLAQGAGRGPPRLRHEPQQPGPAVQGHGRLRRGRAAVPPGAGDPARRPGRGAPRLRHEPQQPGGAVPGHGRLRPGRAAVPAGAGDPAKAPRRGAPRLRHEPQQPGRAVPVHGRLRRGRAAVPPGPGDPQKALGEGHPDYAKSLNNLAALYQSMGDFSRAEPLYQQALEIRKKALGEEHPDYATSLNNLAALYHAMGDYARAEPLFRQALEIRKKALGEEHPDYATSLNNLAGLYRGMGDYARAEPLYRQAPEIRKKCSARTTPTTPRASTTWLGTPVDGRLRPRRTAVPPGAGDRKKVLGEGTRTTPPASPIWPRCTSPWATIPAPSRCTGRRWRTIARRWARVTPTTPKASTIWPGCIGRWATTPAPSRSTARALEIRKKVLGEAHPRYAASLANLALVYQSVGDFLRAEPLYRQAIEIERKALGEGHPDYAMSLSNLAKLYHAMGNFSRAEPLLKQSLEINSAFVHTMSEGLGERQHLRLHEIAVLPWTPTSPWLQRSSPGPRSCIASSSIGKGPPPSDLRRTVWPAISPSCVRPSRGSPRWAAQLAQLAFATPSDAPLPRGASNSTRCASARKTWRLISRTRRPRFARSNGCRRSDRKRLPPHCRPGRSSSICSNTPISLLPRRAKGSSNELRFWRSCCVPASLWPSSLSGTVQPISEAVVAWRRAFEARHKRMRFRRPPRN